MKRSEMITKYWDKIAETMVDRYEVVLNSHGRCQYSVYIWEDGEIECLQDVQGGNTYLKPRDCESRELYYVCCVDAPCFDPWDLTDHSAPDDEEEREAEELEIIEWAVDDYKSRIDDILDAIITEAEQEEMFEEGELQ